MAMVDEASLNVNELVISEQESYLKNYIWITGHVPDGDPTGPIRHIQTCGENSQSTASPAGASGVPNWAV